MFDENFNTVAVVQNFVKGTGLFAGVGDFSQKLKMLCTSLTYRERILSVTVMFQAALSRRILSRVENGALEMKAYCFEKRVAVRVGFWFDFFIAQ